MRGEGRTFHLTRDSRRSRFHAMVEDVDEGGFREVALSVHRGSRCVADVYVTVDEITREPIVYITAGGDGQGDHEIIVRPLRQAPEAVTFE